MDTLARFLGHLSPFFTFNSFVLSVDSNDGGGEGDEGDNGGDGDKGGSGGDGQEGSWRDGLRDDLKNSPTVQKYKDLNEFVEAHNSLNKLLGHEKVPIPKGPDDTEGWDRLNKALGVPEKADGYGLEDIKIDDVVKGQLLDKQEFGEIAHKLSLTPAQAKSLWENYNNLSQEQYLKAQKDFQTHIDTLRNNLKKEWGDAYESNIDIVKTLIDRFAGDKDSAEYLTASILQDPRGIKFLSKIGEKFSEHKIDGMQYKRHSFSPDEAQREIDTILSDPKHPYNDATAPADARKAAIEYVNDLYSVKLGVKR